MSKSIGGLKSMKAGPINGKSDRGGEYQSDELQLSGKKSTIPARADVKGAQVDGPYGGKKPQS